MKITAKQLDKLIEQKLRKILSEGEFVLNTFNNDVYKPTKDLFDKFIDTIHKSESYESKKLYYDEIIQKLTDQYNTFDSNCRQILKQIEQTRL